MATATRQVKPRSKPIVTRSAHVEFIRDGLHTLDLTVTTNGNTERFSYYVEDLGTDSDDLGDRTILRQCYRVHKARLEAVEGEPTNYDCKIDTQPLDPKNPVHACECKGFLRWNRCKHTAAIAALIKTGKL